MVKSSSPAMPYYSITDGLIILGGVGIIVVTKSVNSFLNGLIPKSI